MGPGRPRGRPSCPGSAVSSGFDVRRIVVAPGDERAFDDAEWRDSLVVVASGALELECSSGARRRFRRGDVLWLTGLPLRALRSCGGGATVLLAISRAGGDEFPDKRPSHDRGRRR